MKDSSINLDSSIRDRLIVHDPETGYTVPQSMKFKWQGPQLIEGKASKDLVNAEVSVDLKGLIEKVDILGEIPYMVRKMVNYVAGTKPYLHQYLNPATLKITLPSKELSVEGSLFCEATFISEV